MGEMTGKACLIDGSVSHANLLELQLRRLQGILLLQIRIVHVQSSVEAFFRSKNCVNFVFIPFLSKTFQCMCILFE